MTYVEKNVFFGHELITPGNVILFCGTGTLLMRGNTIIKLWLGTCGNEIILNHIVVGCKFCSDNVVNKGNYTFITKILYILYTIYI